MLESLDVGERRVPTDVEPAEPDFDDFFGDVLSDDNSLLLFDT